jgi:hypothetical protein
MLPPFPHAAEGADERDSVSEWAYPAEGSEMGRVIRPGPHQRKRSAAGEHAGISAWNRINVTTQQPAG